MPSPRPSVAVPGGFSRGPVLNSTELSTRCNLVFSLFGRKDRPVARRTREGTAGRIPATTRPRPVDRDRSAEAQRETRAAHRGQDRPDRVRDDRRGGGHGTPCPRPCRWARHAMLERAAGKQWRARADARPTPGDAGRQSGVAPPDASSAPAVLGDTMPARWRSRCTTPRCRRTRGSGDPVCERAVAGRGSRLLRRSRCERGRLTASPQAWLMLLRRPSGDRRAGAVRDAGLEYAARFERSPPPWVGTDNSKPSHRGARGHGRHRGGPDSRSDSTPPRRGSWRSPRRALAAGEPYRRFHRDRRVRRRAADARLRLFSTVWQSPKTDWPCAVRRAVRSARATRSSPGAATIPTADGSSRSRPCGCSGEQQAFDDLSIDYCVTYEVSPPSWEPMPPNGRIAAAIRRRQASEGGVEPGTARVDGGAFVLCGEMRRPDGRPNWPRCATSPTPARRGRRLSRPAPPGLRRCRRTAQ